MDSNNTGDPQLNENTLDPSVIAACINVKLSNGATQSFFVKILSHELGKNMVYAEFESMQEIHKTQPEFVPKPIAWGSYQNAPNTHFFMSEYRDMIKDKMPDPQPFAACLSKLHQNSTSPNGKFGFHTTTYSGNLPQMVEWEDSWEVFFSKSLRLALELELNTKGPNAEVDSFLPALFDKVIPRLLRPLERNGRYVKPSLVHGDLWYANSGVDIHTGQPLVFDACCFYAHHEYEFGQWMPACNRFGDDYLEAYRSYVPKSAPEEDYDGRLDLYKLRFNTHVSALFPQDRQLREQMVGDIRDLVNRYGSG
ncbi:hypothetical protein MW887_002561 [Aspergillus wentii]|nr:hypothetical protein MW887_002561 [Aspergillus wentii]